MVERVQEHLESIYGIRCESRANEYLVSEEAAVLLGWSGRAKEELLVLEDDGALEVALFLDRALVERFRPYTDASVDVPLEQELDGYCQVAEGVSHFVYLAQTLDRERSVSLLELETQAEIDKFATCVLQRWSAGISWAQHLMPRLFDNVSYIEGLSEGERARYEEANRVAKAYCGRLLPHVRQRQLDRFLSELRYSYRLGAQAKIRYLANSG